jgi:hypothetical protein
MQYKVPQNIDLEDKIVGPLTLAQFLYLLFGGLIVYIVYQFFYERAPGIFYLIGLPVGLVALGLAFVKVHDRPLGTFIKNALAFLTAPRERVWKKKEELEGTTVISGAQAVKPAPPPAQKKMAQSELEKLSEILDTYGEPSGPRLTGQSPTSPTPNTRPYGQSQNKS